MEIISSIVSILYLVRSYKHIAYRSSWYISLLLLGFFLTSTYEITYFDFMSSLVDFNFKFNGIKNLVSYWISGSTIGLLMSGFLFMIVKSNLYKLSHPLIIELLFLSISSSVILIKVLEPLNYIPIIISIWIAFFLNYFKNKIPIKSIDPKFSSYINANRLKITNISLRLIPSTLFLFISIFSKPKLGDLGLMSESHIFSVFLYFIILVVSILLEGLISTKVFLKILPIGFIYIGLIIASFIPSDLNTFISRGVLSLGCLTPIILFPIIELMISRYYQVGKSQIIFNFLKVPNTIFKFIVKLISILVFISYIFYVTTQ